MYSLQPNIPRLHRILRNISKVCVSLKVGDSLTETSYWRCVLLSCWVHSLCLCLTHRDVFAYLVDISGSEGSFLKNFGAFT